MNTLFLTALGCILCLIGLIGYAAYDANYANDITNMQYATENQSTLQGYLNSPSPMLNAFAIPSNIKYPGILLIPDAKGLNHNMRELADQFVKAGYLVFGVDTHRELSADTQLGAWYLAMTYRAAQIPPDIDAAYTFFSRFPNVDKTRLIVVGVGTGGLQALRLRTQYSNIATTVLFYANALRIESNLADMQKSTTPILGILGAKEISVEAVDAFGQTLMNHNIENQLHRYDGVGYGFINSDSLKTEAAVQQAWQDILAYLSVLPQQ